jgi:membrane glycosyltransferase
MARIIGAKSDSASIPTRAEASPDSNTERVTKPALPREIAMNMPVQSFERWAQKDRYRWQDPDQSYTPWLARLCVFGGGLLVTIFGAYEIYGVVSVGGVTILEWLLLILFLLNFSWIALAFSSAIVGFFSLLLNDHGTLKVPGSLKYRTAIIMPIYNEAPSRVFGAIEAMIEDVRKTGFIAHFDFFLLSDTTDTDVWIAEERAFLAIRATLPDDVNLYYRRRLKNTARKAGNIADFVTRWGGA